jgi:hypothetical protein
MCRRPAPNHPARRRPGRRATELASNKPVGLRLAHFAQFKAGRLLNIRVVLDTFDLVEQALGRPIHLPKLALRY